MPWAVMRRIASIAGLLLMTTVALAVVASIVGMLWHQFTPEEIIVGCIVGAAFIAIGFDRNPFPVPRNTSVHGAARPARQDETLRAARGDAKSSLHEQTFKD